MPGQGRRKATDSRHHARRGGGGHLKHACQAPGVRPAWRARRLVRLQLAQGRMLRCAAPAAADVQHKRCQPAAAAAGSACIRSSGSTEDVLSPFSIRAGGRGAASANNPAAAAAAAAPVSPLSLRAGGGNAADAPLPASAAAPIAPLPPLSLQARGGNASGARLKAPLLLSACMWNCLPPPDPVLPL